MEKSLHLSFLFSLGPIIVFVCLGIMVMFLSDFATAQNRTEEVMKVNVGVVVDYGALVGMMGLSCINMSLSGLYESHGHNFSTRLVLHTRDSKSDVVEAASAALDLIKNVRVQAIIGPVTSTQANFIVDLGEKAQVPIISYSAASPSLSVRSSYFFRATENAASQVKSISALVKAFGWKQVVPIYTDGPYGEGLIPFLTDALLEVDARIPYRSVVSSSDDKKLEEELSKLVTMQTRVFILHTNVSLGTRIFAKAKDIGMMGKGYVWIVTNVMTNLLNSIETSKVVRTMSGVLGIKTYVRETQEVKDFGQKWRREFKENLNVFGFWAYDAAKALAIAVEEVGKSGNSFGYKRKNIVGNYSTDLDTFGASQNGPKIHQALSNVAFKGLSGNFSFVKGELDSSTYEIINIVNGSEKGVGFWTPRNGLSRNLSSEDETRNEYNTSKDNLGPITWPGGESQSAPKGWEIPIHGTRLRVGVPLRGGFKEFVDVEYNDDNTTYNVTGYCIDIFEAAMKALPYRIDYDFIPFVNSSRQSNGTYDDLVYQVYLKGFDAVAGDTTIRANRSSYVDFTLPYTESGVSMLVPVKDKGNKNAWVFLKPLTWDLWMTSACFFVFIGFVVWVLEHRINDDFRGPPLHQIGTSFWFSFSTMVFAQRERVISNLARFVITIWVFVVLILTQSYTASLTSLLTVQQLQPTVTNVSQLIKNGDKVGYLEGSFVYGILKGLGFNESQLKVYRSREELHEAFSSYTRGHEGIAAAFEEIPYIKLFLKKYCSKYSMVDPKFKTDGFGFVFPRGSPLVHDVSRALLNVTEGDKMKEIENKWFGNDSSCPDPSTKDSSSSLGLESFWGLFLIAGVTSLCALAIHGVIFFHGQRDIIQSSAPAEASVWERFLVVCKVFDQKDLSSHTFRKSGANEVPLGQGNDSVHGVNVPLEVIGNSNSQPISPSSDSNHTDFNFAGFSSEQESSPPHYENLDQAAFAAHFSNVQNQEARDTNSS